MDLVPRGLIIAPKPQRLHYGPKDILVIAGPVGAGKSTLFKAVISDPQVTRLQFDTYYERELQENGGEGDSKDRFERALAALFEDLERLAGTRPVAVEMSALHQAQRSELSRIAAAAGVSLQLIFVEASLEECLEAQQSRERPTAEENVRQSFAEWQRLRADLGDRDLWKERAKAWNLEGVSSILVLDRAGALGLRAARFDSAA